MEPSRDTRTMIARLATVAAAVLLTGCAAATSPTPTGTAVSTATGSNLPGSAAPGSPAPADPSVVFSWPDGAAPTVSRAMTGLDEAYINPGAVIDEDGTLHMFANLFTAWPGPVQVMHLSSADGAAWELVDDAPVLDSDDVPYARPGMDVSTGFVTDAGIWVLVFETVNAAAPWEVGVATGPGPNGPWTVAPEPVLTGGAAGSWDAGGISWPSVVPTDAGYTMYYSTYATNRRQTVIGRATSTDGLTWTKDDAPVLSPEQAWEGPSLDRPRVARLDDGYVMVYSGVDLTDRGVAFSADGVAWTRDGDVPAITQEGFPVDGRAWDAALIQRDGVLTYYLEIGTATAAIGTEIYRATADLP
jgi:predicted GH43/DUF377 family glycosyl hydrolase